MNQSRLSLRCCGFSFSHSTTPQRAGHRPKRTGDRGPSDRVVCFSAADGEETSSIAGTDGPVRADGVVSAFFSADGGEEAPPLRGTDGPVKADGGAAEASRRSAGRAGRPPASGRPEAKTRGPAGTAVQRSAGVDSPKVRTERREDDSFDLREGALRRP